MQKDVYHHCSISLFLVFTHCFFLTIRLFILTEIGTSVDVICLITISIAVTYRFYDQCLIPENKLTLQDMAITVKLGGFYFIRKPLHKMEIISWSRDSYSHLLFRKNMMITSYWKPHLIIRWTLSRYSIQVSDSKFRLLKPKHMLAWGLQILRGGGLSDFDICDVMWTRFFLTWEYKNLTQSYNSSLRWVVLQNPGSKIQPAMHIVALRYFTI